QVRTAGSASSAFAVLASEEPSQKKRPIPHEKGVSPRRSTHGSPRTFTKEIDGPFALTEGFDEEDPMLTIIRAIGLAMVAATGAGAQGITRIPVASSSKLWIEGTSNVHNWKCE